ncbi:MAG: MFS transporter [Halioglobus sp.]
MISKIRFLFPRDLSDADIALLLLLGAAFVVGHYDLTTLTLAVPHVQATFAVPEDELGQMIAIIRLGAIPAILLALVADRMGRRRLLMATLIGMSVFTLATAFAQTPNQFMLFQSMVRLFGSLEEILAVVYALETLPARHRGWGVGFLAAMGGIGTGVGSLLYGVVDYLPGQWRAMYGLGGLAILLVFWLRRNLPESTLFLEQRAQTRNEPAVSPLAPLIEILTKHRRPIIALAVIASAFWFQVTAVVNFMSKYLQEVHSYTTLQVSALFIVSGVLAVVGNIASGTASDRFGRKPLLAGAIIVNCTAALVFYNASGFWLPVAWTLTLMSFLVVDLITYTLAGELFPTSCRSTSSTIRSLFSVLGAAAGLAFESYLYAITGSHAQALSFMTFSSLLALPVVAWMLRETANTELH